ncbi:BamA/TamA family outer membrane protein [Candidatus Acetothermia bacterium]|nr:BamA/TamA family outer membrane protein [Candidatus Acetothermia bacterium]MBI3642520.1 BamA/TamA family outer membrane protein [Candidatus Acetothermia bacterium]
MTHRVEMNRWMLRVGMIALALLIFGQGATEVVQAQSFQSDTKKVVVDSIQVKGNDHVSLVKILDVLPFKKGDEITIPDDLKRAELKIKNIGLFQDAAADSHANEKGTGVVVTIQVFENPLIEKIDVVGNRNWNGEKRIQVLGLSLPWPFVKYTVPPERVSEILTNYGIKKGEVFNSVQFQKALGIDMTGHCSKMPPSPSICNEYHSKEYVLFDIASASAGKVVHIEFLERVVERVDVEGVESPYKEEAEKLLKEMPLLKPIKISELQGNLQKLAQSVYFAPLKDSDLVPQQGSTPDRIVLTVNLKVNQILDQAIQINSVKFTGNRAFYAAELEHKVELKPGVVDNFTLLKAIEGVHRFYLKEGYVMTQVSKDSIQNGVLTLKVDEGRIGEIEIQQNGIPTVSITEKEPFKPIPLPEGVKPSTSTSSDTSTSSPPDQKTSPENTGDEDHPTVLGSSDQNNPAVRFFQDFSKFLGDLLGTTASSGLPFTDPKVIAKQLAIKPGQYLNQFMLAETYRKLLDLGYFKDVNFNFDAKTPDGQKVIVNVIEQDKLGDFRFGGSVSSEGLVGQLSIKSKNLHGTGQDVSVELDRGILGKSVITWSLNYESRTMIEGSDYFSVNFYNKTTNEKEPRSHVLNRVGGEASLAYPFNDIQLVLGLRHELFTKEYDDSKEPAKESGISSVLSLTFNHDNRNNPIFATRGGSRSLKIERAGLLTGSEQFTRLQTTLIQHFPTMEDQNIALRLFWGWGDDLPSQEQFTLGGSTTLRGVKPMNSSSIAYLNAEYRIMLEPNFSIALFADFGSDTSNLDKSFKLKKSVGIEGRVTIPYVGPIRVAFAWPVTNKLEELKVEFGFGTLF